MWVRKITSHGDSLKVTMPKTLLRELGWELGDHMCIFLGDHDQIILMRFDPALRPDIKDEATIQEEEREAESKDIEL